MARRLSVFVAFLLFLPAALAVDVEEKFPDGKIKLMYKTDAEGHKNGAYLENYENGKPKVKATYAADELDGPYTSYFENGKIQLSATYKKGKLHGWRTEHDQDKTVSSQFMKDDEVLLPKSLEQIKKVLAEIQRSTAGKGADAEREAALRRLKAYRYLCDLPYDDLTLDDDYDKLTLAGAKLCEKIGHLEHTPENPGLPKDEYDLGFKGTSHSNLGLGYRALADSVDGYMDDSDAGNRDRVGHRRWCLNPAMQKTGFGRSGKFSAMYSFDGAREKVPEYDFVSFPARGLMPMSFFKASYVWSVSVNPTKYAEPGEGVKVNVYLADKEYKKSGKPLELTYFKIDNKGFAIPNCIIFQPKIGGTTNRYWVEVEGVQTKDGKPATLHWVTEFVAP